VVDAGPGLSSEQAVRVFERFYRADPARSRAQGGNGLGLAIVAAISAAHGGVVEVDTAPGQGATFRVLLPVAGLVRPGPQPWVVEAGPGAARPAAVPAGQGPPVA
jgi:two-component system OmpR family sensor kinase